MDQQYFKGRGAQIKPDNRFLKKQYVTEFDEGLDEPLLEAPNTKVFQENSKTIVNKVNSPDLPFRYSLNPYQGCEHGCIYCYARPTHEYYGFSAGLDFESNIIVKQNAPALLEQFLSRQNWHPAPIELSGNTDCYQPQERKLKLTRKILEVLLRYRNPVGIITKNKLIERDLDVLQELASMRLVHVMISITTLDEALRQKLEPRTATAKGRLRTVEALTKAGVPVGVMMAPIIPGLNHHEIPAVLKASVDHGAVAAGMTMVRLNGSLEPLFSDWLRKNYPDRYDKVWNQICSLHGGQVGDKRMGYRFSGEGHFATAIHQLFKASKRKYFKERELPPYDLTKFRKKGMDWLF